jgi:hypothetical protein
MVLSGNPHGDGETYTIRNAADLEQAVLEELDVASVGAGRDVSGECPRICATLRQHGSVLLPDGERLYLMRASRAEVTG